MVYMIKIACAPGSRSDNPRAEDKRWVTFEWTIKPHMTWTPEVSKEIDHRLVVEFWSQEMRLLKHWDDIVCVKFVEDEGMYKMQLYDSHNKEIQHIYLHCATIRDNDKLKFFKTALTKDSYEWNRDLHWNFEANKNGFTASMQHLPYAKFNTARCNPYIV